jgi:hypothetical protein
MKKKTLLTAVSAGLISLSLVSTADAALLGRLAVTSGGTDYQAYYDTVAGLTWLADANNSLTSGHDDNGQMNWQDANAWAAQLNVGGVSGWRLPSVVDTGTVGCNFTADGTDCGYNVDTTTGEMANLYYNVLGNLGGFDTNENEQPDGGLKNTGPFSNIQTSYYWTDTNYENDLTGNSAWNFWMSDGLKNLTTKNTNLHAWAVQSGDVGSSAVPLPAAVWLFGSGLLGLIGVVKRKNTNI